MENELKTAQKWQIFSNFTLKIIALISMTLDHIGLAISMYDTNNVLVTPFRIIGRLALPLFAFMIFEGMIHTKSKSKYILRLGVMAILIAISLVLLKYLPLGMSSIADAGNIFIDLLLGACMLYFLFQKNKYIKLLAILPVLYSIGSAAVINYEITNSMTIHWFPFFLRGQYNYYSVGLILLFYLSYIFSKIYVRWYAKSIDLNENIFIGTYLEHTAYTSICAILSFTFTFIFVMIENSFATIAVNCQMYAIISSAFILLYNGKRGYNSKWFQYGCYIYYPLHILIIGLVLYLITL